MITFVCLIGAPKYDPAKIIAEHKMPRRDCAPGPAVGQLVQGVILIPAIPRDVAISLISQRSVLRRTKYRLTH
eukprot:9473262-Pyramimonas_sp.AAC.1